MPAELTAIADLAAHPGFILRVRAAIVKAAVAVANENDAGTNVSTLRHALATNVLLDSQTYAMRFAWAVATNPSVELNSPSGDIEYTANSMWNAVAGIAPTAP
ncbi:hypothetical protein N8J89_08150 [Crossiella sp. CA-258035]|uniref:hypothetical protein n=1 Tax=Crossiella sp. CA-258035 TaxID=2981138 RepID=UPI0024BCDAB8|nr:hypothetical protein [Crossiella sp. CA-258035]WHT21027.1 hypothetical protein N8J89_08150 [Crossiella sp. CA-258035]